MVVDESLQFDAGLAPPRERSVQPQAPSLCSFETESLSWHARTPGTSAGCGTRPRRLWPPPVSLDGCPPATTRERAAAGDGPEYPSHIFHAQRKEQVAPIWNFVRPLLLSATGHATTPCRVDGQTCSGSRYVRPHSPRRPRQRC